ncbi:(R,R)-butanediol dehydrogenase / meso-butanediol dehydrogenase / diacetyl reductase [Sphingobium faniae]|nr:(R,R)-butanediol dehydrogenase / meso-butanediol dehydrogenase / diacetyl reductase [Sphingobium faniae]
MKVAAIISQGRLGVREQDMPEPGAGEVLLRIGRVGICGSDLHYLPHAPVGGVIGHEFVGTVVAQGPGVSSPALGERVCTIPCIGCGRCADCLAGDPVQCPEVRFHGGGKLEGMGGFSEYVLAGARECIRLPDNVPDATAALIEPLAVGLHVVESAAMQPGERLLVLGAGPIGLACVTWARALGVGDIVVSDPLAARRDLALRMGATGTVDPMTVEPGAFCRKRHGIEADVVIECIGRPGRLDAAAAAARRSGRVMLAGMLLEEESYNPMPLFMKGLRIQFVIQYALRHFAHAVTMLEQGRIDPTPMITAQIALDELPDMMEKLLRPNPHCKVLVAPHS